MVLKLHGMTTASCTQRVAVVLKEKNVPFELVPVDLSAGEQKTPEYMEKQPFGQIPYIDDDGFILFESRALGRYIAAKYASQGTQLIPNELKANAKFEQAASIEAFNFEPLAFSYLLDKVYKPRYYGSEPDEARIREELDKFSAKLDAYEVILSKQKYLGGDELTLADLFHLPHGSMVKAASPETFSARPHVAKWFEGLEARPAWIAVKDGVKSG